jgi:hypothetical protein
MRLTIDTKQDSHDEIKHAIEILNQVLTRKGHTYAPTVSPEATPEATTDMMSMFSDNTPVPTETPTESAPDFTSFLNLTNEDTKEEPTEDAKVEYF